MQAKIVEDPQGRRRVDDPCEQPCAIERGMRLIGGKWTGSILWRLQDGPVRFNDLARLVGGASKKMIAERLRHLERHGLAERRVQDTAPVSVTYALTSKGRTALGILDALRQWSEDLPEGDAAPREVAKTTDRAPESASQESGFRSLDKRREKTED